MPCFPERCPEVEMGISIDSLKSPVQGMVKECPKNACLAVASM